jgi:hypothetical protein
MEFLDERFRVAQQRVALRRVEPALHVGNRRESVTYATRGGFTHDLNL